MSDYFDAWLKTVPEAFTKDQLWRIEVYRLALYLVDIGWKDLEIIRKNPATRPMSDQLCRSLGSISANISEGFSRRSALEKARFYEYALGSARESRGWYYQCRHVFNESTIDNRYNILTSIVRLLITMIPQQRNNIREDSADYNLPND
jgi:four helix bundle protein